jgi:hypothetical protein
MVANFQDGVCIVSCNRISSLSRLQQHQPPSCCIKIQLRQVSHRRHTPGGSNSTYAREYKDPRREVVLNFINLSVHEDGNDSSTEKKLQ